MAVLTLDLALRAGPEDGLLYLLAFPVAIVAVTHGPRAAILAVVAAAAVVVAGTTLEQEQMSVLGYASRLLMFSLAGATALLVRRSAVGDLHRSEPLAAEREHNLTPRELEVLRLIASGHTNKEAALALGISVRTIESHRARVQAKLACGGRADLFRHAQELGLIAA